MQFACKELRSGPAGSWSPTGFLPAPRLRLTTNAFICYSPRKYVRSYGGPHMRTTLCAVFPLVLLSAAILLRPSIPLAAQDDSDAAARSQVMTLEKLWNQAYKAG